MFKTPSRSLERREFLKRTALSGLALGAMPSPGLALRGEPDAAPVPFAPAAEDADASVFASARKQLLFPTSVTYCNTGTLGASPRPVVDAMNNGVEKLERSSFTQFE